MKRRIRRRRNGAAAAAEASQLLASVSVSVNADKAHSDAQGVLHDDASSRLENDKGGAISTPRDSPQKTGRSFVTHCCDGLVQNTSKQIASSNDARKSNFQPGNKDDTRKSNFQPGNKEVQVCIEDGASSTSHSYENSIVEISAARGQVFRNGYVSCLDNRRGTQGTEYQNEGSEVKNTGLARNLEGDQRRISPNCTLSQKPEECKQAKNGYSLNSSSLKEESKKRKEIKNGKENNHHNESTSQDSPLPAGTYNSGLMIMVGENNTTDLKRTELRDKQNQHKVVMTNSPSVHNAKITGVNVYNTVEKRDDIIQTRSIKEKETEEVAKPIGSCMLDSNRVARTNVSLIPLQGVRAGSNANTNWLQSASEEKFCQNSVHVGYTEVVYRPYSSEYNQNAKHMEEAIPCPPFISNVSLTPLQGFRAGSNVNTNCLQSASEEEFHRNSFHVGYTKPYSVVSRPYSSEYNQNAKHMEVAIPCPPFISNVRNNAHTIFPSVDQNYQLYPFNEGAGFFQMGNPVYNCVANVGHGMNIFESGAMGNSEYELGQSYFNSTIAERNKLQGKQVAWTSTDHNINCISPLNLAQEYEEKLKIAFSPRPFFIGFQKKKLLILDLNGLLADINQDCHNAHMADAKVRGKLVFRRPYCDDFLNFCIHNFVIGIWSSRKRNNVDSVVDILMRDFKPYLLFCWDMSKCTFTGHKTRENIHKPLVLKELRKLWNKEEPGLPWELGDFSPSNTLLVDDSPYKALRNPPYTAIFPHPYSYHNRNDNSLGPGGDLRIYLEKLAVAGDVERFVRHNPFGQPFITQSDPHWNFYAQIAGGMFP